MSDKSKWDKYVVADSVKAKWDKYSAPAVSVSASTRTDFTMIGLADTCG